MMETYLSKPRIVILHNIISPHVNPIFRELAKIFDVTVLYCSEKEDNRSWSEIPRGFHYKVLPNVSIKMGRKDLFTYFINPSILKELFDLKPQIVIVSGWDLFAYQLAFFFCKLFRIKFILWSGSTEYELSWRRTLSRPLVWLMVKGSDSFIAYGTRAKDYLKNLGADSKKIYISFNTTDLNNYQRLCSRYAQHKNIFKEKLAISNKKIILYYGQLIQRKGVDILIKSFALIKEKNPNTALLIIGSGIYKKYLEELTKQKKLQDVIFIDDPGDKEINKFYAISDIFVLPSHEEVWGLVINQALACGLPVITTNRVGASVDLIKGNYNGLVVPFNDHILMAQAIKKILFDQKIQNKFSQNAKNSIINFFPQKTVLGIIKAIKYSNSL